MAKSTKKKVSAPIFQWTFLSSKEVAGVRAVYTTLLREDYKLSCNCGGWIFAKDKNDRKCRHTKEVLEESKDIIAKYKAGKALPEMTVMDTQLVVANSKKAAGTGPKYGRVIELD